MGKLKNVFVLFFLIFTFVIVSDIILGIVVQAPLGNVAVIRIEGTITPFSDLLSSDTTSDNVISEIDRAESDPSIEAIVLSINSYGGSSVASKEIAERVLRCNKTVVAWIRDIGTSGAYLIAAASDYIVADNMSIVGSIGATMSYLEFSQTLSKYGVNYVRLVSGEHKDIGSPYKNLTSEDREILMSLVNESFSYFLNFVAEKRNLDSNVVEIVSDGRVFSGTQAYSIGLVDRLGSKYEVNSYLESLGIEDIVWEDYSNELPLNPLSFLSLSSDMPLIGLRYSTYD